MDKTLNTYLRAAPEFHLMPPVNDDNETYVYTAGRKVGYKVCPETDFQEFVEEPDISIVEKLKKQNEPLWSEWVKKHQEWYDSTQSKSTWK